MKTLKRLERFGKRLVLKVIAAKNRPDPVEALDVRIEGVRRILVVRQDSRLGNLLLMTPLIDGMREMFPDARIDVLISEGFEDVCMRDPAIDETIVYNKHRLRLMPWNYWALLKKLRRTGYDCAFDVSDGAHLSVNNMLLTAQSAARLRVGYERGDSASFLNVLVPVPPKGTHMTDAMAGLLGPFGAVEKKPMRFVVDDTERAWADAWLRERSLGGLESFFVIHPGGRGKKQWGGVNFAALIDRLTDACGVRIVVIAGRADREVLNQIRETTVAAFDVLEDPSIGQMAAVIEKSDLFISNDTGPMHLAVACGRPTVGIFITSDFRVYGPRGVNGRVVASADGAVSVDDVMLAIDDLLTPGA